MDNIDYTVALEKGRLINKTIRIIDKLAENHLADIDGDISMDDFDMEELKTLIIEARVIKGDRWCFEEDINSFKLLSFRKRGWHKEINIEIILIKTGEIYRFKSLVEASNALGIPALTLSLKNKNKKYIWKKIKNLASS